MNGQECPINAPLQPIQGRVNIVTLTVNDRMAIQELGLSTLIWREKRKMVR